jgi:hypothetical protein
MSTMIRPVSSLLLALAMATGSMANAAAETDGQDSIDVQQMQAAIASFGVSETASEKAATAAAEEIAQNRREADAGAKHSASLIPDNFLDISPY